MSFKEILQAEPLDKIHSCSDDCQRYCDGCQRWFCGDLEFTKRTKINIGDYLDFCPNCSGSN